MVLGLVTNLLAAVLGTSKDVDVLNTPMDWVAKDIPEFIPGMDSNLIADEMRNKFTSTYEQNWTSYSSPKDDQTFDYIIVGGGTSGLVLANRLSRDKGVKILIVEAGGYPGPDSILAARFQLLPKSSSDWSIKAEKQKDRFGGQEGGYTSFISGKLLGGASSVEKNMYLRYGQDDFKRSQLFGRKFSFNKVTEYLRKSENMKDTSIMLDEVLAKQHGTEGPVIINAHNVNKHFKNKEELILKCFKDIGIENVKDLNSDKRNGVSKLQFTIGNKNQKQSVRQSTAQSYYLPIRNKRNIYLLINALVSKIYFNKYKEAIGVEVQKDNKKTTYHAAREVIVTAGPFNSAKLLILSGIGPRKELKKFKIREIANLPVGKNFQDKIKVTVGITGQFNPATKLETVLSAIDVHTFPYPVIGGFLNIDKSEEADVSLRSLFFGAFSPLLLHYLTVVDNYNMPVALSYIQASLDNEILINEVLLLYPMSKGEVTLKSTNPYDPPKVKANFLSNKNDIKVLVKAVKQIYKLKESDYFKKANGKFVAPLLPKCLKHSIGTDEYWECYVKNMAIAASNPYGTCAMGKAGVVDENFKVRNVKKLRVVDPSVMADGQSCNYSQLAMLIAEYAADIIKDENVNK